MALLYQSSALAATRALYYARELTGAIRLIKYLLVLLLCAFVISTATLRFVNLVEAAKVVPPATPVTNSAVMTGIAPAATPDPVSAGAATPTCSPYGAVHGPAPLDMDTPGLQQLIDTPATYRVYGTTSAAVAAQLRRCAPIGPDGNFSATTSYWLGAHYSYTVTPAGACQLSGITVAVHVTQILPTWQDDDTGDLSAKWAEYEHSLAIHENGHSIIDISQAGILLEELSGLPALPCDQIGATASGVVTARLATLDKSNADYDTATRHGAAQGANWQN